MHIEMIAARVGRNGGLEVVNIPKPQPGRGEIIVDMRACGICGTDLEKIGKGTETPPVLGHEVAGVVSEVDADVEEDLAVGDRVFVHHHVSCGKCWFCYNNAETMCELFKKTNIWPGGFSEFFKVPRKNIERGAVHKLPEDIGWVKATFIEPLATVVRAIDKSTLKPGYRVALVGAGPMGMLFISYLRNLGVEEILAVDISSYRCRKAIEIGASRCVPPEKISGLEGTSDITIHATGAVKAFDTSLRLTRRGGEIILFGAPPPRSRIDIPISRIFYDEIRITPSYSTTEKEIETSIRMLEKGLIEVEKIVTHIYTLRNIEKAFETASRSWEVLKVVVVKDSRYIEPELRSRFIE